MTSGRRSNTHRGPRHRLADCLRGRRVVLATKPVGEGVSEYRLDWGPGYRVYFGRDGETLVILLTGGTKQRQQRDIARAKDLWTDYKRRRKPPAP